MQKKALLSKDFILVAIGQIISIFGNQILRYALPLYLLIQTGSSALFGTISAAAFIPMLVLFPIGGIIADRFNKKKIMVILDFCTSALILVFCLLQGRLDIVPLIAATMIVLYAIQGAYQPAVKASVPILADDDHIMQANSVVDVINSVASMAGPVVGGILLSLIGLTPILYISIGCFFVSAVMEIFIRIPPNKLQSKGNIIVTGLSDLKDSFSFIFKKQPILWKVSLVYSSVNLLLVSLVLIAVPVLITQSLGFESDTANRLYGYAQGIFAAGSVLGGLLAGVLSKRLNSKASPFILFGCGASVLLAGVALQILSGAMEIYIIMVIGCGLLMAFSTLFQIQLMSYIQILTPRDLTGKVISCVICVCMCMNPLGQFIYGLVFENIGSSTYVPFYVAALIMIGIAFLNRRIFYGIDSLIKEKSEAGD